MTERSDETLLLCLTATQAGAERITKLALVGRIRPVPGLAVGRSPTACLGDTIAARQFQRCLVTWVAAATGLPKKVTALEGETLRR